MNAQRYYQRVIDRLKNCYQFSHFFIAAGNELADEALDPIFPAIAEPVDQLEKLTVQRGLQVHIPVIGKRSQSVLMPLDLEIFMAGENHKLYEAKDTQRTYFKQIFSVIRFLSYQTGLKNLLYLASFKNKITKQEIINVIKKVGLDPRSKKHVGKYSLGMKQRLGIAQAIMEKPSLILLDEPFNGLDKESIASMRDIMKQIKNDGATIIIATHIKEDVDILCDNVYNIENGDISKIS